MGLAAYQQDTTSLINDYGNLFLPLAQMTRWINEARRQVAYRTGCIRVLVSGQSPWGSQAQAGSMIPGGAMPGVLVDAGPSALATLPVTAVTNSFYAIQGVERYPYDFANPYIKSGNIISVCTRCSAALNTMTRPLRMLYARTMIATSGRTSNPTIRTTAYMFGRMMTATSASAKPVAFLPVRGRTSILVKTWGGLVTARPPTPWFRRRWR